MITFLPENERTGLLVGRGRGIPGTVAQGVPLLDTVSYAVQAHQTEGMPTPILTLVSRHHPQLEDKDRKVET